MDIQFYPEGFSPKPKAEIVIEQMEVAVYPDRFRVFVHIVVTPFHDRPNLLLIAREKDTGAIRAELNIIETMHHDMEFTMHLRTNGADPAGEYRLEAELFFETRNPPQHRHSIEFTVPTAGELEQ
jgi:hypothetical protein